MSSDNKDAKIAERLTAALKASATIIEELEIPRNKQVDYQKVESLIKKLTNIQEEGEQKLEVLKGQNDEDSAAEVKNLESILKDLDNNMTTIESYKPEEEWSSN
ncbi:hypothetical protein L211DRAFT_883609 [Terfezia boudieri ATCC MYA-4762]|uniref:Tubulin-specific chaperone A n=1 Tax=Terfezia boudieri ATCC MYA-4762 TaxID=1051890 RepID=A0A3N4LJM4_9PEZI|nr:hypothetical protein L211DRAFT_883609 [Terfezia boudieri ATCC MYA-4762]